MISIVGGVLGWIKVADLSFAKVGKDPDGILLLSRCVILDESMNFHVQLTRQVYPISYKEHELWKAFQRQITNLKQRLEGATEKRETTEDSSLNDDLLHVMKENAKAFCDAHPPGTFGRIFWKSQMQAASLKDKRQMRWVLSWYGGVSIFATCPVQHMNYCKNQGPSCSHLREHLGTTPYYTKATVGFANDVDSVEDYDQESESHLCPLTNEEQCALRYVAGYTIHKNVKLMMAGSKMEDVTMVYGSEISLKHYSQALSAIRCKQFLPDCALGICNSCPGTDKLKKNLLEYFDENEFDEIQYKQWTTTDQSQLETISQSTEEFVEMFIEKLQVLSRHDFIAKEQSNYLKDRKAALNEDKVLVLGDFSENYTFIIQDAIQGYHWTNTQATLHPYVYYLNCEGVGLIHGSYVAISDCNIHNAVAVHLFQRHLVEFLKTNYKVTQMIHFSDGCAGQYKNCKNFINLCHHYEDFGFVAEWHFFATSHGKGPPDGVGGTVEREAAKASLQRVHSGHITTPLELFTFCQSKMTGITFKYLTSQDWGEETESTKRKAVKSQNNCWNTKTALFLAADNQDPTGEGVQYKQCLPH
ncbi:hypothetical protein EMCRGX_G019797 [Ephydatia muelleri]